MTLIPSTTIVFSGALFGGLTAAVGRERAFRAQRPRYRSREFEQASLHALERARGSADFEFLERQPMDTRDLRRHLRRKRNDFLAQYLQETRESFLVSVRVAREFAADTDAPELSFAILRQTFRFHLLWVALRLSSVCHLTGLAWRLTETLVRAARPSTLSNASASDMAPSASS
jgi:hypothetical protein